MASIGVPRARFTDPKTGEITREWYLFLMAIHAKVGGVVDTDTADLATRAKDRTIMESFEWVS